MLKKLLAISLIAACSTAFAEGTMTEQLKASIDPSNVRIAYDVYQGGWNNRYTFAQKDKDFYVQKDYPIFQPVQYKRMGFMGFGGVGRVGAPPKKKPIENKTGRKPIKLNDYRGEPVDYVNERTKNLFNLFMHGKSNALDVLVGGAAGPAMSALATLSKEEQKKLNDLFDLCIGYQDKIYMVGRGAEIAGWIKAEDAVPEQLKDKPLVLLTEHFLFPNAIKDVLLATPQNHEIKFVQSYEQIIDNELCVAEEFTSQELTDQGVPQGKEMHFIFYYKDGKLAYFDRNEDNMNYGTFLGMKGTSNYLNKVIALDQNVDDYVFESLKHYDMGELKKRGE
ncbi:MAG: hypothetical protein IJR05_01455 [Acidaminococcaceae bacterium]|nr:hypothetical protein [Acidaminococcaceae bacterium]